MGWTCGGETRKLRDVSVGAVGKPSGKRLRELLVLCCWHKAGQGAWRKERKKGKKERRKEGKKEL